MSNCCTPDGRYTLGLPEGLVRQTKRLAINARVARTWLSSELRIIHILWMSHSHSAFCLQLGPFERLVSWKGGASHEPITMLQRGTIALLMTTSQLRQSMVFSSHDSGALNRALLGTEQVVT